MQWLGLLWRRYGRRWLRRDPAAVHTARSWPGDARDTTDPWRGVIARF